ncbi:hypothetical protein IQ238_22940 [Pleurocapsales cyanobacterium LEGE 06147]|nr:hypothetical protein [Pleurocapsales cyanobacterium LEGE 06147]
MKLVQLDKDPYDYSKIYVQVYCALLVRSETSGFLPSIPSTQDRAKADAIAKVAGIHTDAIVEYLMTNLSRETRSAKS